MPLAYSFQKSTMHFYLPRRNRRRLLLPPGLLALAGLLLLGCLALRPWQERLTRRSVIQLTMPPINESRTIWPVEYFEDCDSFMFKEPKLSYSNVLTYRNWITVYFGQGQRQDTLATHEIKRYLDDNGPESSWGNSGLRVCFVPRTHYSSFIMVINLLHRFYIQQYFLDIRNEPVALYALAVPKSKCPPRPK